MSKRLEMLEKLVGSGTTDPFAWYGLAMELRSLGQRERSLETFRTLRERSPDYVPLYLMAAQVGIELGDQAAAREFAEAGLVAAQKKGDSKAHGELETLIAGLV